MKKLVEENYLKFCRLEGNDFIASEYALQRILQIIDEFEVRSILEIGLGIGSISDTILKYSKVTDKSIKYVGTESNEFCKLALPENVEFYSHIEQYNQLSDINNGSKFDLIIIDGEEGCLEKVNEKCKEHAILFIEGDRSAQTKQMVNLFPRAVHVNLISLNKNKSYAHGICHSNNYVGGGQLIFTNPTSSMKTYWIREKLRTFFKRRYRIITRYFQSAKR